MAGRGPQSFKKRQKEQQRKERQEEKRAKRLQRRQEGPQPEGTDLEVQDGSVPEDVVEGAVPAVENPEQDQH